MNQLAHLPLKQSKAYACWKELSKNIDIILDLSIYHISSRTSSIKSVGVYFLYATLNQACKRHQEHNV